MFVKMFDDSKLNIMELYTKYLKNKNIVNYINDINNKTLSETGNLKVKFPNIENEEVFLRCYLINELNNIVPLIIEDYGKFISDDKKNILSNLKHNVVVINSEKIKNDLYIEEGKLCVNTLFLKGNSIYDKIINVKGILVNELFHVFINLMSSKSYDIKLVLNNGEINLSDMSGIILNEGIISKIVSDFCLKHKLYNVMNASNISYISIVNYILTRCKNVSHLIFNKSYNDFLDFLPLEERLVYLKEEAKSIAVRIKKIKLEDIKDVVVSGVEEEIVIINNSNESDLESLVNYCESKNISVTNYWKKDSENIFIDFLYDDYNINYINCMIHHLNEKGYSFKYCKAMDGKSFFTVSDFNNNIEDTKLYLDLNICLRKYDKNINYYRGLPNDLKKFLELSLEVESDEFMEVQGNSKYFQLAYNCNSNCYEYVMKTHDSYYSSQALKIGFNQCESSFTPRLLIKGENREHLYSILSDFTNKIKSYLANE